MKMGNQVTSSSLASRGNSSKGIARVHREQQILELNLGKPASRPKPINGSLSSLIYELLAPLMSRWLIEKYGLTPEMIRTVSLKKRTR
jgi:hypothetical protein